MVREKLAQGGGLVPDTSGEDHVPKTVKNQYNPLQMSMINSEDPINCTDRILKTVSMKIPPLMSTDQNLSSLSWTIVINTKLPSLSVDCE